ncbi:MAG: hypothetical protein U5K55_11685 [Aliarcobacter sp.]|nr:hypothetical protein [Aliarcobacter sp.]
METTEVRKLPKRTIFIIILMGIIGIGIFFLLKDLKEQKLTEILATIGHSDIKSLEVINKLSVEDTETRYKSTVYKVIFYDNNLKQTCIGFIHRNRDGSYTKDFDCK